MEEKEIVIVGAVRTAIGKFGGSLAGVPASTLGAEVIKALITTSGLDAAQIDEVLLGQVLTAGIGQNGARQAALSAGLPYAVSATTLNKVCGSGLKAVQLGAQAIRCGDARVVIAGGQENMSAAPHLLPHSRNGQRMGDWALIDSMIVDGLWDVFNDYHMGATAENIAEREKITRQEQDAFAVASQQKAESAIQSGRFKGEITPITLPQPKGSPVVFDTDEFPRFGTTLEALAKLKPAFRQEGGTVTPGNASGINDGAAAVLIMEAKTAEKQGLTPLARIVSTGCSGVDPAFMGTGPIDATRQALKKAGWTVDDLDVIEANEAFAAQAIAVNRALVWDLAKVNVNGGAIALGHPIGASGARILVTLIHEMQKRKAKKGLATLCIGGGQGIAMALER